MKETKHMHPIRFAAFGIDYIKKWAIRYQKYVKKIAKVGGMMYIRGHYNLVTLIKS